MPTDYEWESARLGLRGNTLCNIGGNIRFTNNSPDLCRKQKWRIGKSKSHSRTFSEDAFQEYSKISTSTLCSSYSKFANDENLIPEAKERNNKKHKFPGFMTPQLRRRPKFRGGTALPTFEDKQYNKYQEELLDTVTYHGMDGNYHVGFAHDGRPKSAKNAYKKAPILPENLHPKSPHSKRALFLGSNSVMREKQQAQNDEKCASNSDYTQSPFFHSRSQSTKSSHTCSQSDLFRVSLSREISTLSRSGNFSSQFHSNSSSENIPLSPTDYSKIYPKQSQFRQHVSISEFNNQNKYSSISSSLKSSFSFNIERLKNQAPKTLPEELHKREQSWVGRF